MTQNTLSDEINGMVEEWRKHLRDLDDLNTGMPIDSYFKGDIYYDGLEMEQRLRNALASIAEKTVEAVRVERCQVVPKLEALAETPGYEGWSEQEKDDAQNLQVGEAWGYNQAITEQSKKAKEWLGKE